MCVTLLTNSVATPNSRERLDDGAWIRTFTLRELLNEGDVTTLVAGLSWALALLHMVLAEAEGVERQGMWQALHDRIEEAGVTEVIHSKSDSTGQGLRCLCITRLRRFSSISHKKVSVLIFHGLKSACHTAWVLGNACTHWFRLPPLLRLKMCWVVIRAIVVVYFRSHRREFVRRASLSTLIIGELAAIWRIAKALTLTSIMVAPSGEAVSSFAARHYLLKINKETLIL